MNRIEAFVGSTRAITLPRVYAVNHERARRIDYRHLIGALVRKPQAFRYSQLRGDLLPNATYRAIWQQTSAASCRLCEVKSRTSCPACGLHHSFRRWGCIYNLRFVNRVVSR